MSKATKSDDSSESKPATSELYNAVLESNSSKANAIMSEYSLIEDLLYFDSPLDRDTASVVLSYIGNVSAIILFAWKQMLDIVEFSEGNSFWIPLPNPRLRDRATKVEEALCDDKLCLGLTLIDSGLERTRTDKRDVKILAREESDEYEIGVCFYQSVGLDPSGSSSGSHHWAWSWNGGDITLMQYMIYHYRASPLMKVRSRYGVCALQQCAQRSERHLMEILLISDWQDVMTDLIRARAGDVADADADGGGDEIVYGKLYSAVKAHFPKFIEDPLKYILRVLKHKWFHLRGVIWLPPLAGSLDVRISKSYLEVKNCVSKFATMRKWLINRAMVEQHVAAIVQEIVRVNDRRLLRQVLTCPEFEELRDDDKQCFVEGFDGMQAMIDACLRDKYPIWTKIDWLAEALEIIEADIPQAVETGAAGGSESGDSRADGQDEDDTTNCTIL